MEIFIILGLILLNGLLSMSEIALVSARKTKLETDTKKGNKAAATALKLANQPEKFLPTIQIGITLIGILTGLYSGEKLADDFAQVFRDIPALYPYETTIAKAIIVITVTFLTLILGELVPKHLGMNSPERIAKFIAKPMLFLAKITSPFVWILSTSTTSIVRLLGIKPSQDSKVTEEEIKAIIQEGTEDGEVQEMEQDIVERVFNLGDRKIGSIMTHRNDLIWFDMKENYKSILDKVEENIFTVYPVADGELDKIVGVVYLKDLFFHIHNPGFQLEDHLQRAYYFPENQSVYKVLESLKHDHIKYGLITDEFGSIQGIITLKDIVNSLLGDISETPEEPEIIPREDGSLFVDGQCSFYNFLEYTDLECLYSECHYNTISGLILHILEHIPHTGEKLTWNRFTFEIVDMDGARIDKILVTKR